MKNNLLKPLPLLMALFISTSVIADDWPAALADSRSIHPNQARGGITTDIDVLGNDIGTGLLITEVNAWSEKGGQVWSETTNVTYLPPANFTGEDTFWYAMTDYKGRTNAAKVTVTVESADSRFPNPANDKFSVEKGKSIRIDILKNDNFFTSVGTISQFNEWSREGGQIKVDLPDPSLAFYPIENAQLVYTPPLGFTGTDTFWYAIKSKMGSSDLTNSYGEHAAKVTIEVTESNQAGPYPVTKEDFVHAAYVCVRGFCPRSKNQFFVTSNDTGKNLKIATDSAYSLKGGNVSVRGGNLSTIAHIYYQPSLLALEEESDKIWYTIEDEVGRKNFGVVNIKVSWGGQ